MRLYFLLFSPIELSWTSRSYARGQYEMVIVIQSCSNQGDILLLYALSVAGYSICLCECEMVTPDKVHKKFYFTCPRIACLGS